MGTNVSVGAKQEPAVTPAESTAAKGAVKPGEARVAIHFIKKFKDGDLVVAIARILADMTGNADYPAPAPKLEVVSAAYDTFVAAVHANDGGVKTVLARNQARVAVETVVRELAGYVQHACQGDVLRLVGSGFPAQRPPGQADLLPLAPPTGLKLRRGKVSGLVFARCNTVVSARLYQWRYATTSAPTAWTLGDTSSASAYALAGLASATQYVLQVRTYGARGASDWSDSLTFVAI